MSDTKFTPGPWYINGSFVYAECEAAAQRAVVKVDRNCGATVSPLANIIGRNNDAHVANAHLIAAAPELYEAMEDVVKAYKSYRRAEGDDESSDSIELAEAALAKARGETA